jgi:hypothetical protein
MHLFLIGEEGHLFLVYLDKMAVCDMISLSSGCSVYRTINLPPFSGRGKDGDRK